MPDKFKEDFFERIVNVAWQEEKKVYWMAGDSQGAVYSYGSQYYTSDDGMHWVEHQGGNGKPGSLYGFTSGLWMRSSFDPNGAPLWILGGEGVTAGYGARMSGISISHDGQSFSSTQWFDEGSFFVSQFFCDGVDLRGSGTARLESATFGWANTFTSEDGEKWERQGSSNGRSARKPIGQSAGKPIDPKIAPPNLLILPPERRPDASVNFVVPDDFEITASHSIDATAIPVMPRSYASTRTIAAPRAAENTKPIKQNDIYQLSNRGKATGLLRKGPLSGKTVTIEHNRSHGFHGPGTPGVDYFDPDCTISDAKTGKPYGTSKCGIQFCHSLAYGYYTFVVVGGNKQGRSLISYTENGLKWHTQTIGNPSQSMWSLVVGPRPGL
jgi:hypothetical protein